MYRVYLHEFCKVVTSAQLSWTTEEEVYLHEFCKVVTSDVWFTVKQDEMYLHEFCKVVTLKMNHKPKLCKMKGNKLWGN